MNPLSTKAAHVDASIEMRAQQFFAVLRAAPYAAAVVAVTVDATTHILQANEAWSALFAHAHEFHGMALDELCDPGDREVLRQGLLSSLTRDGAVQRVRVHLPTGHERVPVTFSPLDPPSDRTRLVAVHVGMPRSPEELATLERLALYDDLTGLANRPLLHDRLATAVERARRHESVVAVALTDLDDFKSVNDTYGHRVGDELLVAFAERLREGLRGSDTAARWGGDEFVLLHEDLGDPTEAVTIAQRTTERLSRPFELSVGELQVTASMGIVVVDKRHGSVADTLAEADIAMYDAKVRGKPWVLFEESRPEGLAHTIRLSEDLKQAIPKRQLRLRYQPIVTADLEHVVGVQALLRWRHPELKLLRPGQFEAAASRAHLMEAIGSWVLSDATAQLQRWDQQRSDAALSLWVSIVPGHLGSRALPQILDAALQRSGISPERLHLDLPVMALRGLSADAAAEFRALGERNISLGLRGFGLAPFSVTDLTDQPLRYVKLDAALLGQGVRGSDRTVAAAVAELAHQFGLQVVAEGVASRQQAGWTRDAGADLIQGSVCGRLRTADAVDALVATT